MKEIYKYRVKQEYIFNLESCHDKFYCIMYDIDDDKIKCPIEIAGFKINESEDMYKLIDMVDDLAWAAKCRKVSSREYRLIHDFAFWRTTCRYFACLENGMNEADAGRCFEGL